MFDLYQEITDRIIAALESGVAPWTQPWVGGGDCAISHETGRAYSLLNQMLLCKPGEYLTFKAVEREGGKIKKGCKARMVVFWKWIEKPVLRGGKEVLNPDGTVKVQSIPFLKYYNVWHIDNTEGIQPRFTGKAAQFPTEPIAAAEAAFFGYTSRSGVTVKIGESSRAFYRPSEDLIRLPGLDQFRDAAEYYSTAFHEATHSTGHPKRLNRLTDCAAFGSDDYSKEELVAELGSCFILGRLGINSNSAFRNSAAYINGWLGALRNDKRLIVSAAGAAEKAAGLIMGEA